MKKLIFLCLMLTICTLVQGIASAQTINDLDGTSWTLSWMEGLSVDISPSGFTLNFSSDGFGGKSGCNSYWGKYELQDGQIIVKNSGTTLMFCGATSFVEGESIDTSIMAAESAFKSLLFGANHSITNDGMLILSDDTGAEMATFIPNPTEPAQTINELEGTSWTLSWMEGGYPADTAPITIEFGLDEFSGRFFCNNHWSEYELRDGQIVFTGDWTQTFAYCIDEDAMTAEVTISRLLSGTPRYSLTDDGMLMLSDGTGAEIATFMPNATESVPLAVTLSETAATSTTLLTWVSFAMLLAIGTFIINRKQTNKS